MARSLRLAAPLLLALLALALGAATAAAKAAPFPFDPSFGDHGSVEPIFPPTYLGTHFTSAKVGADGSILTTRQDSESGAGYVTVGRYLADGRADPSFKSAYENERAEAVDSQGRILRAGTDRRLLERLNPDGSVDATFGHPAGPQGPSVYLDFDIEAVLPLASGKIVVAGSALARGEEVGGLIREIDVARYDESGTLDPTFGSSGVYALPIGEGARREEVVGLTVGAGEDVLVSLRDRPPNTNGLPGYGGGSRVAAVAGDGHLDPGFATAGILRSPDAIDAVVALPDGGLLVAGEHWGAPLTKYVDASDIYLTRLTPAGAPDPTFGEAGGTKRVDLGPIDHAASLLLRPDGSIVLGGATTTPRLTCPGYEEFYCEETPVLVGFTANGHLDPGFATAGILRFDSLTFDLAPLEAVGTVLLGEVPGGDLLAGGGTWKGAFLAEVGPGGRLDPRFGEGGLVTVVRPHQSNATAEGIAVDSGGRILAYGQTNAGGLGGNSSGGPAVFRMRPDGSVDHSFADGRGYLQIPGSQVGIAVDSRGRALVLAGKYTDDTLIRVTASGELDPSFGSGGVASLPERASILFQDRRRALGFFPRTVTPLPDGGALVMGAAVGGGAASLWRIEVMRLTDRGRLDRSFGRDGRVILSLGHRGECNARAMTVLRDGRILLGGSIRGGRAPHERQTAALIRLRPDGSLDRSFGKGGVVTIDGPGKTLITALAVGPQGEVVTGGRRIRGKRWTGLLARFSPTGRLDRAFVDRAAGTFRGPGKDATSPSQILVAGGRILTVHAYWPQALVYGAGGSFERRIVFGKRRNPHTWVMSTARQGDGIVVAAKVGGHPSITLRRLLIK